MLKHFEDKFSPVLPRETCPWSVYEQSCKRELQWGSEYQTSNTKGFEYGTLKFWMEKVWNGSRFVKNIQKPNVFSPEQVWNIWIPNVLSISDPSWSWNPNARLWHLSPHGWSDISKTGSYWTELVRYSDSPSTIQEYISVKKCQLVVPITSR